MAGNWWDADEIDGSGEFWSADEVVDSTEPSYLSDPPGVDDDVQGDYMRRMAARDPASALRHKAETEPGAGRGSANDPRRLDTEKGRKLLAVERELVDLAALNPWEDRESLRPAAESAASGHKPGKPVNRVKQYTDKGMGERDATVNALFDERYEKEMQSRIDGRDVLDAPIGGDVRLGYNPNTEAEATASRAKELKQSRADAMMRADAEGMNPVARGFVKGAGQAIALTQGSAGLVGDLTGNDALKKWGLDGYAENMRAAGNLGVAKPFTQTSSADDAATWLAENSGYVAFQAAQSILAGGMGGVIGNTIGKKALGEAVGLAVASASQTYGSVYAEAVEESQRTGKPLDMEKALIGATVSTAIDTLADKIGLDAITAKGFKGNALSRAGKAFGLQAVVQGGTEAAQLVPEEFGAGRDPFRDGMLKQYIDEAAVGALGGVGPGVAMAVKRNIDDDPARALSHALESEPVLSPESLAQLTKPVDAKAAVESARDAAMADIGKAQSVDEAVAAANATVNLAGRAVQIDNDRLLDEAVQAAGIADALAPMEQPTMAAPVGVPQAAPLAEGQDVVPATDFSRPGAVAPSRVVWTGRRGDGYATPEDASRALNERQRLRPAYDWTVQQNPEGRYVLEGLPKGQDGAARAVSSVGNTKVAPMAQNAPEAAYGGGDVSVQRQAPAGSVWAKSDDGRVDESVAAAVEELAVASGKPGSVQLLSRAESLRELDVRVANDAKRLPAGAAAPDANSILTGIEDVAEAAGIAFGWRPSLVKGLPNAFGVQYKNRTFLDIGTIAGGNKAGDSVGVLAIQTVGHETTHALQKSADPQDRADWQRLRDVVLANAKDGVVAERIRDEDNGATYGENEVVADVSGNFWLEPKFWQRLYELDDGSTMRRIAYKFMQNATRLLGAVKSKRMDNRAWINNIEQVREVAAQVWASKAKRGDSLFGGQDQTISKSPADDSRPGVSAEVAPDPRNQEAAQKWGKLTELDKLGITKEVMDKLAAKVFDKMGLTGWGVEYTSGMFEGGINPSAIIRAPKGTDAETLGEVMRVFGYLLDQKGMVAFDESNTTSGSQAGFVKVVLPKGLSTSRIDAIRKEIAAKVPQAEGDTVRDGAIVYGNFSALNDKIETLTDEQFYDAIAAVVDAMPEQTETAGPFRFHSEYDQAYWSEDTYDPKGREAYLEKTRYANNSQEATPGRDGVRRWGRDSVFRPWLQALARSTDAHIAQLVGDKQPRTADARADRAGPEQPAQQGDRDRQGRPDAVRSRVVGVDASAVGGAGKDVSGAVHYGKVGRLSMLAGAMSGTGIKGAEAGRLAQATDPRIRQRVYFYLPVEGGIPQPESGLGQHVYKADLSNLYDTASQKMRLPADQNAMESAILDAGYSGFFNEAQGTVVVFGASVPVSYEGTSDQFNKVKRQPKAVKQKTVTRAEGDMLVRKPEGAEVMEVIKARQAGLEMAAPSFKMQYGEARVLKSEAATADAVFESIGASFRFDEPSYSKDFDDLGAFNVDASLSEMTDAEMEKFGIEPVTEMDMEAIQAELEAEFAAEFGALSKKSHSGPGKEAIAKAGLNAEDAFDFGGALKEGGRGLLYDAPDFAQDVVARVRLGGAPTAPSATVDMLNHTAVFVNSGTARKDAVEKFIGRQIAGAVLHADGHDIASAYRKNTILNLAASWKAVTRTAGVFKFSEGSKATGFTDIAKSMGAFKGYRVETSKTYNGFAVEFVRQSDGEAFSAEVTIGDGIGCCTMGLDGSGGLGTEFYAVMGRYAQNNGKRFLADDYLSGINSYRRTEQALSFALKSGDTGVLLPGLQNRVYGYNMRPKNQQDHDMNLARLALAGLRNVQELFPEVRRLSYDPATDRFSDSRGDAEDKVTAALKDRDARAFGLGRSTIARAVITSQIIKGEAIKADRFESPIAYSLADVGMDEPMAESWGDGAGGVQPGLRNFMAGSKIVHEDGRPVVMYHGTARDIHAFRGKQAGAIFLSYSPRFAGDFAALSGQWMQDHWDQVLTPEQIEQAKKTAAAAVMADKSVKMAERKAMKQSIMDGKPEGMAADAMNEAVRDMMPSGENILPVFVRATAPFDFRDKAMVDDVVGFLFDKNMAGENDKVRIRLVSEKGDRANMNARVMRELISGGAWDVIESPEVQEVIRELGHDGFFVKEDGQINLAVYEPGQVKSVFNRGTFDPLDERLSYSRAAGPKEFNYRDNYLVPELDGAFDDDSGNIAVMPALIFAKDGIRREFKSMPVRIRVGDHQYGDELKKQYGLQHRIGNKSKDASRAYITPELDGDNASALEVERAARDITLGILDAQTAYADSAPAKIYLHSPSLNRSTVLERQTDSKGKPFWSVVTSMPSTREQMMRRYKAPTSIFGLTLNGDKSQQSVETQRGILKKLREPGRPQLSAESYILDDDGLLIHQDPAPESTNKVDAPKVVKQLARDENGRIILNKRKAGVSMSRADIDGLGMYSALARGIGDIKASAAPAAGWKELVKGMVNKGQAKQDEVEWSGLNDWLDTRQGRVTKDEVLEYLRGNGVQVQEVVLGSAAYFAGPDAAIEYLAQRYGQTPDEVREDYGYADERDYITLAQSVVDDRGDQSKYGKYTLPGGENYREVLLTLPERSDRVMFYQVVGAYPKDGFGSRDEAQAYIDGLTERAKIATTDPATKEVGELLLAQFERDPFSIHEYESKESRAKSYRSSHWDQPNILAHIRVNDRTDADGKRVLFVEEIQSDFGQDGKKKGFGLTPSEQRRADALSAKMDAGTASESERAEARELGKKIVNPIPAAPFVTKTEGWLNLALKRVITMAVQGGYDKVAFVTGEQSADRYDLSKQVEAISVTPGRDGTYDIEVEMLEGGKQHFRDKTPQEVEDTIGKEMAVKSIAAADAWLEANKAYRAALMRDGVPDAELDELREARDAIETEFSGLDLKVGGEGMRVFYDQIVPRVARDVLKKLGGGQLRSVEMTNHHLVEQRPHGWYVVRKHQKTGSMVTISRAFKEQSKAQAEADRLNSRIDGAKSQPGFDITPAMREKVGEGLPSFSRANGGFDLPAEGAFDKTRRKMQDYFLRAQVVQRAIASQGGVVDEQTDFYRAEELSHGRTAALMQDFADQQVRPLMEKAVRLGIELDELSLYAYAMHAKERNAHIASIDPKLQDGGSGMTNAEADDILQLVELSGDKAKFEELHTDLMTITRGNRLAMMADGLITQQEFEALEGAYEYYVPLRGFEKLDEDGKPAPARSAGKGFNIRGAETIKAKGRVSRAGQIIENIIHDHQRTITRGERNHVAKVFLNFVLKNPDSDLWEIDAKTTRKSIDRKTGRIARDTAIEKGEDTIAVKVKGQEIYVRIKDEMLLRALRKSHSDETGQLTSDLMRSVGLYSTLLRNTLTRYNPEFAVVNAVRDVGFGATAVLDELGEKGVAKFMGHYAGAMAVSARNESKKLDASREWDKWFYEFKAAGGTTSGFYAKGLDEISGDIRDMMIEAGAATKDWSETLRFNKATRAARAALRVLEYAGSVSENAARVAAYRTAREMGKTPSQAASIAKNLTTNFDRKGEYGQMVNALYLFYNAAIQGTHRTAKMLKNPKVWGYMGGVVAGAASLAFASASAGGDDPDDGMAYWDKIPAHVKERNIIIMLPPEAQVEGAEEVGTKGRYLTIPVQYGLNIFHVIGYQIADVVRNHHDATRGVNWKKGGINIASAFAGSFNPFGGAVDLTSGSSVIQAVLPTLFDFPYQLVSGTNAFGRDVAPFKSPFDHKPDSQNSNVRQAGGPAERVAQWLNEATGGSEYESGAADVSAGTLENVVRGLTGGTGVFIYDVLALGGKWADYVGGDDPDLFIRDVPILRRGMGETAGDVDQGLFYERRKAIQEARAVEKGAEEAGGEITDKEKLALASMSGDAGKYTKWLGQVRKEMKEVQRNKSLTAPERRLKLRELRAERDKLTAEFNASFTEVMREELSSDSGR